MTIIQNPSRAGFGVGISIFARDGKKPTFRLQIKKGLNWRASTISPNIQKFTERQNSGGTGFAASVLLGVLADTVEG